jgi:RecG-like helicase
VQKAGAEITPRAFFPFIRLPPAFRKRSCAIVKNTLEKYKDDIVDVLPKEIREKHNLCTRRSLFVTFIFLKTSKASKSPAGAHFRGAFRSVLRLYLLKQRKHGKRSMTPNAAIDFAPFLAALPFSLTDARKRLFRISGRTF